MGQCNLLPILLNDTISFSPIPEGHIFYTHTLVKKVWLQCVLPDWSKRYGFSVYHQLPTYFLLSMIQHLENGQNRLRNGMFKLHHKGNILSTSADVHTSDFS